MLRELWHWREREALAANRPPFFVLAHEKMVEISIAVSEKKPVDPLIPPRMHPRRRENLFAAIRAAQSGAAGKISRKKSATVRNAPPRRSSAVSGKLKNAATSDAHELGIDPTLIAPKSVLGDLARDWDKHAPELMNWQLELLR